jgi:hypothetical protein
MGLLFNFYTNEETLAYQLCCPSKTVFLFYLNTLTKVSLANNTLGDKKQPRQDMKHTSKRQEQKQGNLSAEIRC